MTVCSNCGAKTDGVEVCPCGVSNPTLGQGNSTSQQHLTQPSTPGAGEYSLGDFAKFNAADEDNATLTIAGFTVKAEIIFWGLSIILYILFFLPFFRFTLTMGTFGSITERFSGWNLMSGSATSIFAVFLFANMIVIDLVLMLKKSLSGMTGKLFMILAIVFGAGLLLMILLNMNVASTRIQFAYIFSFIFWLLGATLALFFFLAGKNK